jgi:glyoxylase-like metal-dependent hydrolase (beta-lactamase superfamily II)
MVKKLKTMIAVLVVSALAAVSSPPAEAAAEMQKTQGPGFFRTKLGDFEVTALYDGGGVGGYQVKMFGAKSEDVVSLLKASSIDPERIVGSVAGFLVNADGKLILIDAGAGDYWHSEILGRLAKNLVASGYRPEQVDLVLLTHLHADHAAGITSLDGKRIYPNAEIRVAKSDADFWLSEEIAKKAPADAKEFFDIARKIAAPYISAGKWRTFEGREEFVPGVRAYSIPGHTAGHTAYEISSKGETLLVWGDVVHLAAVQLPKPEIGIVYDSDGPAAIKARLTLLKDLATKHTLIAGAHMPFPGIGRIRHDGAGYDWSPVSYVGAPF